MNDFKKILIWLDSLNPNLASTLMLLLIAAAVISFGSLLWPIEGYFWIRYSASLICGTTLVGISAEMEKERESA